MLVGEARRGRLAGAAVEHFAGAGIENVFDQRLSPFPVGLPHLTALAGRILFAADLCQVGSQMKVLTLSPAPEALVGHEGTNLIAARRQTRQVERQAADELGIGAQLTR